MSDKQTDTVAEAEATLAGFEKQKAMLVNKQKTLADQRRAAAFDAANGDVAAGKLIEGIVKQVAEHQTKVDAIRVLSARAAIGHAVEASIP